MEVVMTALSAAPFTMLRQHSGHLPSGQGTPFHLSSPMASMPGDALGFPCFLKSVVRCGFVSYLTRVGVCLHVRLCAMYVRGAQGGQKRVPGALNWSCGSLWVATWMLGPNLGLSDYMRLLDFSVCVWGRG